MGFWCGNGFRSFSWPWLAGMGLFHLAGILIISFIIIKLLKNKKSNNDISYDNAIKILKERYALGEIDEVEYNQKLEKFKK